MPQENNPDIAFYVTVGIVAAFMLFIVLYGLYSFFVEFSRELKYLNSEIGRNTAGERRYWRRQRRRLWLSLIPFVKYR